VFAATCATPRCSILWPQSCDSVFTDDARPLRDKPQLSHLLDFVIVDVSEVHPSN
jgi:hypothetical protein